MKIRSSLRISNPQKVEFVGTKYLDKPAMQVIMYGPVSFSEDKDIVISKGIPEPKDDGVYWLNIHGIHEPDLINQVCSGINMPRFIVQDILDTTQRTKFQDLGEYIFFSVKSILADEKHDIDIEQISFILGVNTLYSFQEKKGDHFEHIRIRIRESNGLVRQKGPDFLLYLLLEGILANYFTTVDQLEEDIKENVNPLQSKKADPAIVHEIEDYKRKLLKIRRNIVAIKEAVMSVEKGTSPLIKAEQMKYFYDLKDSCMLLLEHIDSMELRLDSAENLFFSMQGHRMNEVMTTLTIMAAIFIPLTFMAGIYGMNFSNMPELEWEYGYFGLLGMMFLVTLALIYYFKRRKWF